MTGPSEKLTRCPTCGVASEGMVLHEGNHEQGVAAMTQVAKWHDRIGAMIDQVGHPDYSLREMIAGMRAIRDEMVAAPCAEKPRAPGAIDQRDGFGMCAAPKGKAAWAKLDADERKRLQGVMAECRKRIREADNA